MIDTNTMTDQDFLKVFEEIPTALKKTWHQNNYPYEPIPTYMNNIA